MRLLHWIKNGKSSRSRGQRRTPTNQARLAVESLEERVVRSATPAVAASGLLTHLPSTSLVTAVAAQAATVRGYTPAQIDAAYGFNILHNEGITGAGQTIAIIDPYNVAHSQSPNVADLQQDINVFDQQYGLPSLSLQVQYQNPNSPPPEPMDFAWTREAALDVEWAHVVAPGANIILFEANSQGDADLMTTVNVARNYPGVSVVSMSWGFSEDSTSVNDSYFTTPPNHVPITFVASSGDSGNNGGMMQYPATSPYVLAVGGTTLNLGSNGYGSETAWSGSGGGVSQFTPEPAYQVQAGIQTPNGNRAVPDVAYDGDTKTPVMTYDTQYGWDVGAGTSAGAPQWAGLIALANQVRQNVHAAPLANTVADIYSLSAGDFHDITSGSNGGETAGPGYDEVTGRGTPIANLLVADLARTEAIPAPSVAGALINFTNNTGVRMDVSTNSDVLAIGTVTPGAAGSFSFTGTVDGGAIVTGTLTWSGTSYQLNGSWTASGHRYTLAGQLTAPDVAWDGNLQFLGTRTIDNGPPLQIAGSQISLAGDQFALINGDYSGFGIMSTTWTPPAPPKTAQQGSSGNQATENYTFTGMLVALRPGTNQGVPWASFPGTVAWNATSSSFEVVYSWFQIPWVGGPTSPTTALELTITAPDGNWSSGTLQVTGVEVIQGANGYTSHSIQVTGWQVPDNTFAVTASATPPVAHVVSSALLTQLALSESTVTTAQATSDLALASPIASPPSTVDKAKEASLPALLASAKTTQQATLLVDSVFDSTDAAHIDALASISLAGHGKVTR